MSPPTVNAAVPGQEHPPRPATAPAQCRRPLPADAPARQALWLCIHLPDLALETGPECSGLSRATLAVVETRAGRPCIHAVSPAGAAAGIVPGMPLGAACALVPALEVHRRDAGAERAKLQRLAAWVQGFTPTVVPAAGNALLLEVGGSLRLFGGLEALGGRIREGLAGLGHHARLATTPTPEASLLLATTGHEVALTDRTRLRAILGDLPITALSLPDKALHRLDHAGIRTLRELLRLPRDGLARRFGPDLLHHLDRLTGAIPDPRTPWQGPLHYRRECDLEQEVPDIALLFPVAVALIDGLCLWLEARDAGITRLRLILHHLHGPPATITVGTHRLTREAGRLRELLRVHLDALRLRAPVTRMTISVDQALPFTTSTADLFAAQGACGDPAGFERQWEQVLDQLQARLGGDCLRKPCWPADHRPGGIGANGAPRPVAHNPRPLWLLDEPRSLSVRDGHPWRYGPLRLRDGPERIESGWWDGGDIRRDYYVAEDARGQCLWIYRDLRRRDWHVHGIFG